MTQQMLDPLLDSERLEQFLAQHHLSPLHRFGQHFLLDRGVLDEMVAASETDPTVPVIEVGAGLGVLTRALARQREQQAVGSSGQATKPLMAIELDRRLIPLLKKRTLDFSSVHVIHADILRVSVEKLLRTAHCSLPTPYDIVGNIPYNISGKLLEHFLAHTPRPRRVTFLMDAAVAEAISANPPHMSVRAVSVQVFAEPRLVRTKISPKAFLPAPAVESAIVTLPVRTQPRVSPAEEPAFFRLVRAGFSQKRKMLTNALSATYHLPADVAAKRLREAGIDARRRAQTLSLEEWLRLLRVWEPA